MRLRLIRRLAAEGVGVVLISHYLAEIFEVCDDLTVMRDGEVVCGWAGQARRRCREVVKAMVGRDVETSRRKSHLSAAGGGRPLDAGREPDRPGTSARRSASRFSESEVLGVTGLAGSGLNELSRAVFGAARTRGRLAASSIEGRPVPAGDPAGSLAAGIALLTNDRLREGILPDFTLTENICLPILSRFAGFAGALDRQEMEATAERNIKRLRVQRPGTAALLRQLSGGNQQKVLFAKWLETKPKVFVMDEPTIGIDVGSKAEIRGIIDEIAGDRRRHRAGDDRTRRAGRVVRPRAGHVSRRRSSAN